VLSYNDTCFVLGAGFSAPARLPMQAELLRNIGNPKHKDAREYVENIFNVKELGIEVKDVTLEDVFTFLDKIIARNGAVGDFDLRYAYDAKFCLVNYIINEFNDVLKEMYGEYKYTQFFKTIANHNIYDGENNSIISFNWDTIPDFYINREYAFLGKNNGVDYCCYDWDFDSKEAHKFGGRMPSILRKAMGYKTTKIMKPHGSINWVYRKEIEGILVKEQLGDFPCGLVITEEMRKEYEHVLMTPTFVKDLSAQYTQSIWQNMSLDLSEYSRLVFLGCSLPLSDYEFRNLLLKTAVRNKDMKVRILLYPADSKTTKAETKKRFQTLFVGNNLKFEEMDIADFLVDRNMIWNW